jgi:hypothetical protein
MANYIPIEHIGEMYGENRDEMTPTRRKMIHRDIARKKALGQELPFQIGIFKNKLGNKPYTQYVVCPACARNIPIKDITFCIICRCGELINTDEKIDE